MTIDDPRGGMAKWLGFVAALTLVGISGGAPAQDYPNRPVRIIVGYVPGPTGPDFSARVMAPKLAQILGAAFVVENRPGAGGTIATAQVAKSPADGYTLLLGETGQLEIAPYLNKALPYDPVKDLTPIAAAKLPPRHSVARVSASRACRRSASAAG